jgi:hypothetical protein
MTDGVNLYRMLGSLTPYGTHEITAVEDCCSLDMVLLPLAELRQLRPVVTMEGLA